MNGRPGQFPAVPHAVGETSRITRFLVSANKIVTEPFVLPAISRRLAFFCDPFGNLIELAEVLP